MYGTGRRQVGLNGCWIREMREEMLVALLSAQARVCRLCLSIIESASQSRRFRRPHCAVGWSVRSLVSLASMLRSLDSTGLQIFKSSWPLTSSDGLADYYGSSRAVFVLKSRSESIEKKACPLWARSSQINSTSCAHTENSCAMLVKPLDEPRTELFL